jgi:hypothetical protein
VLLPAKSKPTARGPKAASDVEDQPDAQARNPDENNRAAASVAVKIDTKANMLGATGQQAHRGVSSYDRFRADRLTHRRVEVAPNHQDANFSV